MPSNLEKLVYEWVAVEADKIDIAADYYCQTRDIFQARLEKMQGDLLSGGKIQEENIYLISAVAGEIGNNSFDHNSGRWPDIPGIFFTYGFFDDKLGVALADRGVGIWQTLKAVKPELENDEQALLAAFSEKISGRAPENRGNGLKFVKEVVRNTSLHLVLVSGTARAELGAAVEIKESGKNIKGCLAILSAK